MTDNLIEYKNIKYVLLNKNGNITDKRFSKNLDTDLANYLNKATRMKLPYLPMKLYSFDVDSSVLDVWGFIDGKSGQENKHDLPPGGKYYVNNFNKSDTDLLFGDIFVVKYTNEKPDNLNSESYTKYYTELFGGFEILGETDSVRSEESEPTQEDLDFIVDDNSELSYDESWDPEDYNEPEESLSDSIESE